MELEDLRGVQQEERNSDALADVPDSFYREFGGYISDLREKYNEFEDKLGTDAKKIEDELTSAREVIDSIQDRRIGKIVNLASLKANGVSVDESKMTVEEKKMFDDIVRDIEKSRRDIDDVIEGDEAFDSDSEVEDEDLEKGYRRIRAKKDLQTIMGADGEKYSLSDGETAVIPEKNARALCEKDAADFVE